MRTHLLGLLAALWLLALPACVKAQTVAPFGGLGQAQFFDNSGAILTNGVLYSYQAGTTTQQATFTDSTGLAMNPNPVPFGSGARAQIWLSIGSLYKFVLCVQNDGAFCAPSDVLFSVDQVPATAGGSGTGSPFIGIFISGTVSPSTSGILRLASSDTICWRNNSGSTNLCISKDANDLLSWAGGSIKLPEVGAPTPAGGFDLLWADNTAHRLKMAGNGGAAVQLVGSGVDINASDQVTQVHFGATAAPFSATPPSTNQCLQWSGSQIVGASCIGSSYTNSATGTATNLLVKLVNAPSTAITAAITDKKGIIGVCVSGCGTTGSAMVSTVGQASCVFDGATTAGDYVQNSSVTGGDCHDAGVAWPVNGNQVLGRVLTTNGATGTYNMTLFGTENSSAQGWGQWFSTTGCTPPTSTDGSCTGTITLPATYPDAVYIPVLTVNSNNGAFISISVSGGLAAGSFPYTVTCTFNCSSTVAPTIYVHTRHN